MSEQPEALRLLDEVERMVRGHEHDPQWAARLYNALLAHIQRGAVPEGYDIAPSFRGYARLGIGQYVLHNCPRSDDERPSLVIAIATEEEKADRQVGELRHVTPGLMIQPDRIAVRLDFENAAALDALEQQLRFLREDSFPGSLAAPASNGGAVPDMYDRIAEAHDASLDEDHTGCRAILKECMRLLAPAPDHFRDAAQMVAEPEDNGFDLLHDRPHTEMPGCRGVKSVKVRATAGVPMPKPVAYGFGNTAITGHTNRLMMVRIDIPGGDQYAGAFWLPLVLADEAHAYGVACRAAGEAAGYARGLRDAVRDAAPLIQKGEVLVTVTGLTGSGKSAIAGEIEIMCRALGLDVEWVGGDAEKRLTHADWTDALEMYRPRVRIIEANISQADAAMRGEVKP